MGSGASTALPDDVDLETFRTLAGDQFDRDFFEAIMDPQSHTVPKEKLIWYAKLCDVFISIAARKDVDAGLELIAKAEKLSSSLRERGLVTRIGSHSNAHEYNEEIAVRQLNYSQVLLCLATETYIERVNRTDEVHQNITRTEFLHALDTKSLSKIAFAAMEKPLLNHSNWKGAMGTIISGANVGKSGQNGVKPEEQAQVPAQGKKRIHDFTADFVKDNSDYEAHVDSLVEELLQMMNPYRFAGYPSEEEYTRREQNENDEQARRKAAAKKGSQTRSSFHIEAPGDALSAAMMAINAVLETSTDDGITTEATTSSAGTSSISLPRRNSRGQLITAEEQQQQQGIERRASAENESKVAAYKDRLIKWISGHTSEIPSGKVKEYAEVLVASGITSVNKLAVDLNKKTDLLKSLGVADEHAVEINKAAKEMLQVMKATASTQRDLVKESRTGPSSAVVSDSAAGLVASKQTTAKDRTDEFLHSVQQAHAVLHAQRSFHQLAAGKNANAKDAKSKNEKDPPASTNTRSKEGSRNGSKTSTAMDAHLQELWALEHEEGGLMHDGDTDIAYNGDGDDTVKERYRPGVWSNPFVQV